MVLCAERPKPWCPKPWRPKSCALNPGAAPQVERVRDVLQDDVQAHIDRVGEAQCEGALARPPLCLPLPLCRV